MLLMISVTNDNGKPKQIKGMYKASLKRCFSLLKVVSPFFFLCPHSAGRMRALPGALY